MHPHRAAWHDVPGRTGQQAPRARHHLRQDEKTIRATDRRRPREDGDVSLRPEQGPHHLAFEVIDIAKQRRISTWVKIRVIRVQPEFLIEPRRGSALKPKVGSISRFRESLPWVTYQPIFNLNEVVPVEVCC